MSPTRLAAAPLSASTSSDVNTPLPLVSVAYCASVDAVRMLTPGVTSDAWWPAGVPAIPEWQLSRKITLFRAGDALAYVITSANGSPSSPSVQSLLHR